MSGSVHRPTYIGIHSRDASTQVLYVSSGIRQSTGYTPAEVVSKSAHDFIADPYKDDYSTIYETSEEEQAADDEANAYVMYGNIRTANGDPVLHRITSFKCDNCVIFIAMGFHDIPYQSKNELEVQMLDGAMKRVNVTRDKGAGQSDINNHQQAAARWRERAESGYGQRVPLYCAQSRQIKAAFVLENPSATEVQADEGTRRLNGPLVAFVTGSVGRLIDADTSDIMRLPFLKLVAPEDLLCVSKFFERLGETTDVLFETFSLLQRPHIIDGDIVVADEQNTRVVVECLGANVQDGMVLLLRKLRSQAPPTMDDMGNYLRPKVLDANEDSGYKTLSEIISDDPETSDAGEWSRLL
ncbi:hypothetical protein LPJ59_000835 [Coemansia sp. RSA 2399]|nr:hypothetical protein LPJ59_000835 [Coemansia sp. RSA 2399]KAJ1906726.1 hypothetical protein LPJ81_001196 [Coemansia sp. IMI 209127]